MRPELQFSRLQLKTSNQTQLFFELAEYLVFLQCQGLSQYQTIHYEVLFQHLRITVCSQEFTASNLSHCNILSADVDSFKWPKSSQSEADRVTFFLVCNFLSKKNETLLSAGAVPSFQISLGLITKFRLNEPINTVHFLKYFDTDHNIYFVLALN